MTSKPVVDNAHPGPWMCESPNTYTTPPAKRAVLPVTAAAAIGPWGRGNTQRPVASSRHEQQ
jgi:hypothetical protein